MGTTDDKQKLHTHSQYSKMHVPYMKILASGCINTLQI